MNAQVIALINQKGTVGKSKSRVSLGVVMPKLMVRLGHPQPDTLPVTLSDVIGKVLNDKPIISDEGILYHPEGVNLMPLDIQLSGMGVSLVNAMSRETIMRQYLDTIM